MKFAETDIPGAFLITTDPVCDERGSFTRLFCRDIFAEFGIDFFIAQISTAQNLQAGTLRGLHYQAPPHQEAKLVQCLHGHAYDVMVDLRRTSSTFGQWTSIQLSGRDDHLLFVPPGVAHGYQTLAIDTTMLYAIDCAFTPTSGGGVRYDDPMFNITWPRPPHVISPRDRTFPDFDPTRTPFPES